MNAFNIAKLKYHAEYVAWTNFSGRIAGRFNLPVAVPNIQRQGDLDLLLRCMEDEYEANKTAAQADVTGSILTYNYQLMLSEAWIVGCYEFLRAFRQRDKEALDAGVRPSGVSDMEAFKSILADLELLRMPMTKYEIAKDKGLIEPLPLQRIPANNDATDRYIYDREDPARSHIMPTTTSTRGSIAWLALDHRTRHERWIERRDLAERLLAMGNEIVPAGILEAQERAAQQS
jgi:hypothetical protein